MPRYYTVKQVAGMLSKHTKTIYQWIYEGKLLAHRLGKGYLIQEDDLSKHLKKVEPGEH